MWTRLLLTVSFATTVRAQQDNPMELLRRVQANVAKSLDRIPRYLCTETIDRAQYEPDTRVRGTVCDEGRAQRPSHLETSDRLRLDVGMASTVEMYSWVGENRFDDRDLLEMVQDGTISTGTFATFLAAVFRSDDATFTYDGETTHNGRTVAEFGFSVPYEKSRYFFGGGGHRVTTAYSGTFLVDPNISDLLQLVVRTSQLPAETAACSATTTLDYERVTLGGFDFLLPSGSRLQVLHTDGVRSENKTAFSNCHEFLGESTIQFGPPPDAPGRDAGRDPVSKALRIPHGLRFRVGLSQGIDAATAAAGDPIKAQLLTPVKNGSKVLIKTGAPVVARIVRIRQVYGDAAAISLDIKLETVDVAGVKVQLAVAPDLVNAFPKSKSGALQQRVELGTLLSLQERSFSYVFRNARSPNYLIPSGLESSWVTVDPDSLSAPAK